ncbi:DUF5107 domain-containing protein [Streptomyces sp. SPB162]|uniref:DUF5107 domain-containing protein n=1 Tax=Streptomyces sp. SPB162 TaxID=2940560 RepID=UPI0024056BEB|nr:DUF5107 domain-containing protein [Streptomyces sp. SPB162]MDF9816519.1 tetratricopeptide (TPR) repeat protein [Streptomyces sp. SPB162]
MATTVRRIAVTIPAAPIGPENPLPALRALDEVHRLDPRERAGLPADMARQVGYAPLHSVLPVQLRDGYGRERAPADFEAVVIENDRVRATVLPGLGGRLHSLVHKATGRELLYRNPVVQPADFGLAGAWFSGGVEWNLGATGHTTLTCAPLHAARLPAPDGGEMLRLWEWERLRDLPFQIDMWLPEHSDFLYVGVRIRNPHHRTVPVYWWSNIAVPETDGTRVLAPADEAWHFGYARSLRRVPVPEWDGTDVTYPTRSEHAADYFYELGDGDRRWVTALDGSGQGLVQTSTDRLRGRKLFLWGNGRGGRRWQQWLTEPGTGGYLEIQAGLARTQLEHVPMEAGAEFSWLEAYGPLDADPAAVHGDDWGAARAAVETRLESVLPRADVDAAYAAWLPHADTEPKDVIATGSGWGALEVERARFELPGTPFDPATLGGQQKPWLELLVAGMFPRPVEDAPPGPALVAPEWRELLEAADTYTGNEWYRDYFLGVAQWHAGDRAQAIRSWERSAGQHETWPVLRCLAVADQEEGHLERAADRFLVASDIAHYEVLDDDAWWSASAGLAREAITALLAVGRADDAAFVLDEHVPGHAGRGRFRLLRAQVLLARGDAPAARAIFDAGFVVDDLREAEESLSDTWYAIAERLIAGDGPVTADVRRRARAEHPLPEAYDYRMRPAEEPPNGT